MLAGPEQVLGGSCGEVVSALIIRTVNGPSAPFPSKFSSTVTVPGCCRLTALAAVDVPEYAILTSCPPAGRASAIVRDIAAISRSKYVTVFDFMFFSFSNCVLRLSGPFLLNPFECKRKWQLAHRLRLRSDPGTD